MIRPNIFRVNMHEISVVIPVRNEEKNIDTLLNRLTCTLDELSGDYEVIFVTDINNDNTVGCLAEYSRINNKIKTIKLSNCFGHHIAVIAGLDHCSGKYIVLMDGDLQDYPEDIPLLYVKIKEGFDIVCAVKQNKNQNLYRNFSSKLFNSLINVLADVKFNPNSSMFRIISRKALVEILKFREYDISITYLFGYINLPTSEVKVRSGTRLHGDTKFNLFRLINFALSSLLAFSIKPLRIISFVGVIFSILNFIYLSIIVLQKIFFDIPVMGWATLISIVMLLGGIQLLSLGIIGEYIGRIHIQTKNRPLYVIENIYGYFDTPLPSSGGY